jgi:MATE family multidrug resistance protein
MSLIEDTTDTTQTSPEPVRGDYSAVAAMALPIVVTTVSRTVMGFVDFWMVSKLGTDEQAAMTPALMVVFCFISVGMGIMACVTTFASQALGRNTFADAGAYTWQAIYVASGVGLLGIGLWPFAPTVFGRFGHEPAVLELEIMYGRICLLSVAPSIASAGLANFFVGVHKPSVAMYTAVGANLFNALANYVLIFGGFGWVEPMGMAGAAWGTVLATLFRTMWLLLVFGSPRYARRFSTRRTWRLDWTKLVNLARVGMPASVQFGVDIIGWTLFMMWLVGQFGTAHLAATNIVWQYLHLSFMPALGVGMALNSLVGRSIGAGDIPTALRQVRVGARITISYMSGMGLLFFVFRTPLVRFFNPESAEVVAIGARLMICGALFQTFDAMCITYGNSLRAAGDTLWPALMLAGSFWSVGLVGGYALARFFPEWGSLGPWIGGTGYIIVYGLLLRRRWFSGRWREMDIFRDGVATSAPVASSAGESVNAR